MLHFPSTALDTAEVKSSYFNQSSQIRDLMYIIEFQEGAVEQLRDGCPKDLAITFTYSSEKVYLPPFNQQNKAEPASLQKIVEQDAGYSSEPDSTKNTEQTKRKNLRFSQ